MNDVRIKKQSNQPSNRKNKLGSSVPIKFKAIILKSIYEKHHKKQTQCLRDSFHTWYIQKNNNQMLKNSIDKIMIAQNENNFTPSRFFYRMKFFIRKEKQILQKQHKINDQQYNYKIDNSQINCYGMNKNFTQYFESLKNIFSSKLLQCQNQLQSNKIIQSKGQFYDTVNRKLVRFKTQGNKNGNQLVQNDQSKISIFAQSQQSFQNPPLHARNEEKQRIWKLGSKVAITLIKSTLLSALRRCYTQGFLSILQSSSIQVAKSKISMINKNCFNALQNIINDSQESHLSIQSNNHQKQYNFSQSFIDSESQLSFYIPPTSFIDNQMSQVQYSIDLLSNVIRKDEEVQQLYKEFQQQYEQFANIQRDFDKFKIQTKNSLFQRTQIVQNKITNHLKKFAFCEIKKHSTIQKIKKSTQQFAKSKVDIQNFHQTFSKSLTSAKNTMKSFKSYKNDEQQRQPSITSIRMLNDFNPNTTFKSQKPLIKGGIKKQNLLTYKKTCRDSMQNRMVSTFDEGFRKDKMTLKQVYYQNQSHENIKNVNFKLPNNISQNQLLEQQHYKEKKQKLHLNSKAYINDPIFYDLSTKSIQSNESSQTKKYYSQIKSQYWWNNCDQNQKLNQQNQLTKKYQNL